MRYLTPAGSPRINETAKSLPPTACTQARTRRTRGNGSAHLGRMTIQPTTRPATPVAAVGLSADCNATVAVKGLDDALGAIC